MESFPSGRVIAPKIDWSFKFADMVKIGLLLVAGVLAYAHMEARVSKLEEESAKTQRELSEHIEKQNDTMEGLNALISRLTFILNEYPPHRHEDHSIVYPSDTGKIR